MASHYGHLLQLHTENKVEDNAGSNKTEDAPEIEDNLKKAEEGENPDSNKEWAY